LTEMNGAYCSNRQMRVGIATPKRAIANQQQHSSQGFFSYFSLQLVLPSDSFYLSVLVLSER